MNLHHWPLSTPRKTPRSAVEPLACTEADEECSREFGEFLESVSATAEEIEAVVSMPELTVAEVKRKLRAGRGSSTQEGRIPFGRPGSRVPVEIRPPGGRSPKVSSPRQ